MNKDLFSACCATVERRGPIITPRKYAEEVLTLYLNNGKVPVVLTDEEKTARFKRAQETGIKVVDRLGRKEWVAKEEWE